MKPSYEVKDVIAELNQIERENRVGRYLSISFLIVICFVLFGVTAHAIELDHCTWVQPESAYKACINQAFQSDLAQQQQIDGNIYKQEQQNIRSNYEQQEIMQLDHDIRRLEDGD